MGDDVWQVIEMSDFFKKGLPPIQGGTLDQAQKFLDASRFIWNEQARHRAELGLRTADA